MVSGKGKEKLSDTGGKGKRKLSGIGITDDKTGRKRKNRSGALQFFDDSAYEVNKDEYSSDDDSLSDSDIEGYVSESNEDDISGKAPQFPCIPKEEDMSEEEIERMLGQRYKPGAGFVTHAEDGYEYKKSFERHLVSPKDPAIWKVKCMVGRERYSAFCLMQKYVDLNSLGTKLQIISAFAPDHIKGFIFIEADKQSDIYEACKGLCSIYSTRASPIQSNEMSHLVSVRSKSCGISKGMWARVKNGKYKGDLGMVTAVNDAKKKVTVKLVPRIDLVAMAEKLGGGVTANRTAIPAQRLISSSELEEFRPVIQYRKDRETNEMFEFLDGMMLKDGYLYKKIRFDSMSFWGIVPTEDELLKFESSKKDESVDVQWLSQLFGEKKKQQAENSKADKGGEKSSKGSTSSDHGNNFVHDLVFFGRRDFGVVIGSSEKDGSVKVIKEGLEGPTVVNVKQSELRSADFDKKLFTVLDHHSRKIFVNDCVQVLEGPLKDRQGVVKKIYKGILFLCDENDQDNNGYFCIKGQLCEKINLSGNATTEKGSGSAHSGFADTSLSSPKSPLSPEKSLQDREERHDFKQQENGMFSIGQTLRIRVGPLKGYLCRVLAVRRSEVTVKLDSQQKILTVKCEHLSEVRGRNSAISQGNESGNVKPFDFLGAQDGTGDWMGGTALSTDENSWNAVGSAERGSWPSFPAANSSHLKESGSLNSVDNDVQKEDSGWQIKETSNQNSSWGGNSGGNKAVADSGAADCLGTSSGWNRTSTSADVPSDNWGKSVQPHSGLCDNALANDSWGKVAEREGSKEFDCGSKPLWGQSGVLPAGGDPNKEGNSGSNWGKGSDEKNSSATQWDAAKTWNKAASGGSSMDSVPACDGQSRAWGNSGTADVSDCGGKNWDAIQSDALATEKGQVNGWDKLKPVDTNSETSWHNQDSKSLSKQDGVSSWNKKGEGSSCIQPDEGSSWNKADGGRESGGNWKKGGVGSEKNEPLEGWSRSKPFDMGSGSGGRAGRGSGRGGRDHYSGGRSFGYQSNMYKEGQDIYSSGGGNDSNWNSDKKSDWGNPVPVSGGEKCDGWNNSSDAVKDKEQEWNQGSNASKDTGGNEWSNAKSNRDNTGGWNVSKVSDKSEPPNWGKASEDNNSAWNQISADNTRDQQGGPWKPEKNIDGGSSVGWGQGNWSKTGASDADAAGKDAQGGSWKHGMNNDGGSSTGWGQGNWSKTGANNTGGNQESTWSSKGNWNSGNSDRDETFGDQTRGGSWRGGRGGRSDRGGFRGRRGSGRGDFGDRGGSDQGGNEGRWRSDRGGFRGRGRSDGDGGYRGGGFRGRGRGDWKSSGGDSSDGNSYSWNKGSNPSAGWSSDNQPPPSWSPSAGRDTGGWQSKEHNKAGGPSDSWGKDVATAPVSSSWGSASGNANSSGSWKQPEVADGEDKGQSDSWGKAGTSSWGDGSGKGGW